MNNILIVDDTPDNLRILMELLSEQGYEVSAFSEGNFALESARSNPPDLILLDIRMPGMDGYQVCEQLKADPRTSDIPVIFLSALGEVQDKVKGFERGGVDYITKPFQAEEVLARVQTHITLRALQLHLEERNRELHEENKRRQQAEEELRILNGQLQDTNQQLQNVNHQLHETNQRLQETNASKDAFFSIIAHDLRSPFTSLLGLTEVLIEELDRYHPDRLKRMLQTMHTTAEKAYGLLMNLLEWSRLERRLIHANPEIFPLSVIVDQNVWLQASSLERKQITLRNLTPSGMTVFADLNMIDTIIRNLMSNALKFTASGGTIEISAQSSSHSMVEIAVSDTGIGMSQERIMDLFQIDKRTSRPGTAGEQGTGLGLILCKAFVEQNGGTIRVESEVEKGTTFTFTLPTQ